MPPPLPLLQQVESVEEGEGVEIIATSEQIPQRVDCGGVGGWRLELGAR